MRLKEKDSAVAQVEVNEVLRFCDTDVSGPFSFMSTMQHAFWTCGLADWQHTVSHKAAKVAADDAVPGRAFSLIELSG